MDKKIFLHIGLPKTATTLLQELVFTKIKDIFYIGYPKVDEIQDTPLFYVNELNKNIINKSTDQITEIKNEVINYLDEINKETILFSNETLCGQLAHFSNAKENAIFLKEVFNNSKVIFTIRNQYDWAESVYNQVMTKHNKYIINEEFLGYRHGYSINEFFKFKNNKFQNNSSIYRFNWYSMTKDYIEIFGKENVLVLPYELLKIDLNAFLESFYEFTKLEKYFPEEVKQVNKRIDDNFIKYSPILSKYSQFIHSLSNSRMKNFILKNDRSIKKFLIKNNLRELDISKEKFTEQQKEIIKNYHEESNKKLSELINIDLGQYSYY